MATTTHPAEDNRNKTPYGLSPLTEKFRAELARLIKQGELVKLITTSNKQVTVYTEFNDYFETYEFTLRYPDGSCTSFKGDTIDSTCAEIADYVGPLARVVEA